MAAKARTGKKPARGNGQASRRAAGANAGKQRSPIAWGITGLAMGLMVALLVHLEHTRPDDDGGPDSAGNRPETAGGADQPRFEFYRLLSEQEVEVANREAQTPDDPGARPDANPPESDPEVTAQQDPESGRSEGATAGTGSGARYLLQAGSFRNPSDAESLKANLALLGIEARIQVVELPGGETWHRVRIGPFADLQRVNAVRERMAGERIDAILLRAGG